MAARLLAHEVSDLCLGKPPLSSLPLSATIRQALAALKSSNDTHISIWTCDTLTDECRCVGKICMVDIICYLCSKQDNISSALKAPVSVLLSPVSGIVMHVEPSYSLVEAIDLILLNGAQNLVVPIKNTISKRKPFKPLPSLPSTTLTHGHGREFCWLTQQDIIRFLLSFIGIFSPTAMYSIASLGLINTETLTINYHSPASTALHAISTSLFDQTSVAVTDCNGILVGEISPTTLMHCDETVAAAIMTLSAGDLMAYIDCGGPPEEMVRLVEERLKARDLNAMVEEFWDGYRTSCEENVGTRNGRMMRRAEAIVCGPRSSLVAVMVQAIAMRVGYVWVVEEDCSLVGIVKFSGMLKVFREHLERMVTRESEGGVL